MVTQNKNYRKFRNVVMTTAAVLAIGGAMAKKTNQQHAIAYAAGQWGVEQATVSGQVRYYLKSEISDRSEGTDYDCNSSSNACSISTTASTPTFTDANGTYVLSNATGVTVLSNGTFAE